MLLSARCHLERKKYYTGSNKAEKAFRSVWAVTTVLAGMAGEVLTLQTGLSQDRRMHGLYLHIVFEDICCCMHVHNVINYQLAKGSQKVSSLM